MTEVTFYTRRQCGLCDAAAAELHLLSRELHFSIVERDIDGDAGLRARYNDVVPVIAIGDTVIAHAPIDLAALRGALASALA
jgi:glutaredoxin